MKKLSMVIFISMLGCASLPNRYNTLVQIKSGPYAGQNGILISDCKGFELYKVRLFDSNKIKCFRIWELKTNET